MSDDTARIEELERGFRRDGLPNLIVDYSAAEDIFTRALPFLALVFVLEVVNAIDAETGWTNLALACAGFVSLVAAFGVLNLVRGRRFLSVPDRVGTPELTAFVLLPAVPPLVFGQRYLLALATVAVNLAILGIVYLVVGFRLISILRWTGTRFFSQFRTAGPVLVRAVPLLLFFSLVMFFTTEIWQVFSLSAPAMFWAAIALFVSLGLVFLSVRLPGVIRQVQADSQVGDEPLRTRERRNLALVALISESLQVIFVAAAVWLFYLVLGSFLVNETVRLSWLGEAGREAWSLSLFGERVRFTEPLLRVATGVAAFAGLYYAVAILVDSAYRDQFVDTLTAELEGTFERRTEYLQLVRRREARIGMP